MDPEAIEKIETTKAVEVETTRYESFPLPLKVVFIALTTVGILFSIVYLFGITFRGWAMLNVFYYYALYGCFCTNIFLLKPARKGALRIPWYDLTAAGAMCGLSIYFMSNAWEISQIGWGYPTRLNFALGIAYSLLILEGARRMAGWVYVGICVFFGLYPLFARFMPGLLYGTSSPLLNIVGTNVYGGEGILGLPGRVMGEIIIGFLIFSAILVVTGAGRFFLNLAMSLLGGYRGGPAKVAVVGSALMGSLSGSALSNVVGTGVVTIPTMKRTGYPPEYAGAIEACASTGGVLMPPVMGAVAFVMCTLLEIPYSKVIVAAVLPSLLYYFGLLMQADAYAARMGLRGLSPEEIPSARKILWEGWPFFSVLALLLYLILFLGLEALSPFYASAVLVILSLFTRGSYHMRLQGIPGLLAEIGKLITQAMAVVIPVGFIVNGLTMTGSAASFTAGIVSLAGSNVLLILIMGAAACYVMGMAGMFISAYIFLAVTLAPAVVQTGHLNVLAVHLFILYFAMLSEITPPVALSAFVAASIADADPMRTAYRAMRLGIVLYFIPFFFVYNPALIMQGPWGGILQAFGLALLGVLLVAAGLEGYLLVVGRIGWFDRILFVIAGSLLTFPETVTDLLGLAIALFNLGFLYLRRSRAKKITCTERSQR